MLTTHTLVPFTWYSSEPDSGYSIDNIAPGVPLGFVAAYNTGSGNELSWNPSPEEDFQYYRIYRGSEESFVPDPSTLAAQTAAPEWNDPEYDGWDVYYKITAVDHAGNERCDQARDHNDNRDETCGPRPGRDLREWNDQCSADHRQEHHCGQSRRGTGQQ